MRLEVNLVIAFIEERIQVAKCIEADFHLRLALHQDLLDAAFVNVPVNTRFSAHRTTQQLIDRYIQRATLDVPERNVDGRNRGVNRQPLEVAEAMHHVPVMLDRKRVLADQILGETADRRARRFNMSPCAGLTITGNAFVGIDADKHELANMQWFDFSDLH